MNNCISIISGTWKFAENLRLLIFAQSRGYKSHFNAKLKSGTLKWKMKSSFWFCGELKFDLLWPKWLIVYPAAKGTIPVLLVTAHDRAVRPTLSAILGSALTCNKSCRVVRHTLAGLQKETKQKYHHNFTQIMPMHVT